MFDFHKSRSHDLSFISFISFLTSRANRSGDVIFCFEDSDSCKMIAQLNWDSRAICYKAPGSRILSGFTKFIIWLEAAIPNVWSIVNLFSPSPPISSAINIPPLGFVNGTNPNDSAMLIISGSQAVIIVAMSVLAKMIISSIPIHNLLLSKVRKHW